MKINLNDYVLVKMTEKGIIHYISKYNERLPIKYCISYDKVKSKIDENGFYIFQFHDFMYYFGEFTIVLPEYIDLNIEIKINTNIHEIILNYEKELENEFKVITEAIGDVVSISKMNDYDSAVELIRNQFLIIDRQDLK